MSALFVPAVGALGVTSVELLPVTRLFRRCEEDEELREQLFAKGSGYLLYHVLDDLFDYCFPILDKIGHKLDSIEDDIEGARAASTITLALTLGLLLSRLAKQPVSLGFMLPWAGAIAVMGLMMKVYNNTAESTLALLFVACAVMPQAAAQIPMW